MDRISSTDTVLSLPAPETQGQIGFFSDGDPSTSQLATVVNSDWCNSIQEEIMKPIEMAGISPNYTDNTQLYQAILFLTSHGDLSGGSLHDVATQSINGFMSSTDKTKLDNVKSLVDWKHEVFTDYYDINSSTMTEVPGFNTTLTITADTVVNLNVSTIVNMRTARHSVYFYLRMQKPDNTWVTLDTKIFDGTDKTMSYIISNVHTQELTDVGTYKFAMWVRNDASDSTQNARINAGHDNSGGDPEAESTIDIMAFG